MEGRFETAASMRIGGRVLVVDDDALLCASVRRILAKEGYTVDVAQNGDEALARVSLSVPDLILLDVLMPGMNGRQLLESLRNNAATQSIPILVMTAVQGIDVTAGIASSSVDYVEKPFDIDELLNKVALALYRTRGAANAQVGAAGAPTYDARTARRADTVLMIDDDRGLLASLDSALSARGYTVVSLSRMTDELPRLARVLEPRAILLSLHLPGACGMTALRKLRADESLANTPILVLARQPERLEACRAEIRSLGAEAALKPEAIERICDFAGISLQG